MPLLSLPLPMLWLSECIFLYTYIKTWMGCRPYCHWNISWLLYWILCFQMEQVGPKEKSHRSAHWQVSWLWFGIDIVYAKQKKTKQEKRNALAAVSFMLRNVNLEVSCRVIPVPCKGICFTNCLNHSVLSRVFMCRYSFLRYIVLIIHFDIISLLSYQYTVSRNMPPAQLLQQACSCIYVYVTNKTGVNTSTFNDRHQIDLWVRFAASKKTFILFYSDICCPISKHPYQRAVNVTEILKSPVTFLVPV